MAQQWVSVQSHPHPHLPGSPKAPTPSGPATPPSGAVDWAAVGDPGTLTAYLPSPGGTVYNDYQWPDSNLANPTDDANHYANSPTNTGIYSALNQGGRHDLITDLTAPYPGTCLRWTHPDLGQAGSPGHLVTDTFSATEVFMGGIYKFDAGYPSLSAHKNRYIYYGSSWIIMHWEQNNINMQGNFEPFMSGWGTGDNTNAGDLHSGTGTSAGGDDMTGNWYKWGWYSKSQTVAGNDGIMRVKFQKWNGTGWNAAIQTHNITNFQYASTPFAQFEDYQGDSAQNTEGHDIHRFENVITLKVA